MVQFQESGLTFGPYVKENCFRIEDSKSHKRLGDNVKMAEFVLLKEVAQGASQIWVVECKSSSPRPENSEGFEQFIQDVREKLENGLVLLIASILRSPSGDEPALSAKFRSQDVGAARFRLVLVVNGHRREWLPPLQDSLRARLRVTAKMWRLDPNSVVVMNHDGARQHGLVAAE